ncbi:MAG: Toxin-antitoxin system protein [Candidatus Giovannonibacteria bacterium GW2011_GWC2_44_9]|uniref:Toxin-antitoxin system protein n=3 Tax=Candidatus Giovannoniibacteriota TaxID=1752738 RepID=A0A0G1IYS1_9BACT|nr:MAG: Toxin-antitoxin system protein [Candidatus Giovannonibacteria bacterium GW2011_GWB1_44_23]KKT64180.1 MAG: Toxin-antitoxin system protein [Candidatus Giovannonibacteria bacterium GW2011_GWA1_44_29]KKT83948.1 MAG: Toxin-antitoxin system protein [Candidatus Giovannonibacteria bacterium GW2011_GWC2_44_9]KKT91780.1 MAG: Toxin-antitoxin system protein [Parcubacteria group bacterium GW2011_GWC1_45_13]
MNTVINIKTDQKVKDEAKKIAKEMGLSLSAVINAQLRQLVREQEIRFSVAPNMTSYLENIAKEARSDYARKKNVSPAFGIAESAARYLHGK